MAQVINTNMASLFAAQSLNKSALGLQQAMERLSSGVRINSAKDDPTGLANATTYQAQIRGTNQAIQNANDGISKAQTNDGYLQQITENLQRLRQIAVQNGGTASGVEATALTTENDRIKGLITASGTVVVNADGGTATMTGNGETLTFSTTLSVTNLDSDLTNVTTARSKYGADMATLASAVGNLQVSSVNLSASYSRVMDTDYAAETGNLTRNQILQQAGTAMLAQANQVPNTVLSLLR